MAVPVAKGLYIGSEAALQQSKDLGITHVLSVVNYEVCVPDGLCHWQISLEDCESANLLAELPAAVQWLERAMRQAGSKVLVHCNAGTSRSPSVVVAAIMRAKQLPLARALEVLQSRAPHATPNPGFLAQLELWGEMGCRLDEAHPGYKQFLLDQVACQWEEEGWVDPGRFADLPDDEQALAQLVRYRCRKCRQLVVTQHNIIPQAGVGRRIFRRQRHQQHQQQPGDGVRDGVSDAGMTAPAAALVPAEQGSVFAEPMAWMIDQIVGPVQGKLYCTSCNARLGSFNWAGISNSSGAWMVPGFQLHLSRLDVLSPHKPAALAGMRFPAALAERRPAEQQQQQQQQQEEQQQDFLPDLQAVTEQRLDAAGSGLQQLDLQDNSRCHETTPAAAAAAAAAAASRATTVADTAAADGSSEPAAVAVAGAGAAAGGCWFRYLLLDCDGVLVDSEGASCEALHRAILDATGVDIPHSFPSDYFDVFGMTVRSCVEHYKKRLSRSDWADVDAITAAVTAAKEVHYQQLTAGGIAALPGAAALIQQARALGLPVGVGSSGAPAKIRHNLSSSGLLPLLDPDLIVSAAEVPAGKPAPDVYLEVLRRMATREADQSCKHQHPSNSSPHAAVTAACCAGSGATQVVADSSSSSDGAKVDAAADVKHGSAARQLAAVLHQVDASRALVVEDAVHGLVAARAAGAFAVGVTNSLPAEVLAAHADLVVVSLEQLDLAALQPPPEWMARPEPAAAS